MKEYSFNMDNMKFGKKKSAMKLLIDGEDNLFLSVANNENQEIQRIKVFHISKLKKLTNFFMRGFNIPLEGVEEQNLLIPENELQEAERKIIVTGKDLEKRVQDAIKMLEEKYGGEINRKINSEEYARTMIYLDTPDKQLQKSNRIFRLTQENNNVKATIHMDNNLPGDQKHIIKFFFTDAVISQVVNFFEETLSVLPITKAIPSKRTEYKSSFGEIAVDRVKDENADYYSIELEVDKFMDENRNSQKVNIAAKEIATNLGLADCKIVDEGTEAIFEEVTGKDFFETYSNNQQKNLSD